MTVVSARCQEPWPAPAADRRHRTSIRYRSDPVCGLLRVFLFERLASLADLLDHAMGVVLLDEPLNAGVVVTGDDHEAVAMLEDPTVFVGPELDRLETGHAVALAVEPHRRSDRMTFAPSFDLFVHTTERLFVLSRSLREVHEVFYHPWPPLAGALA